ncbi:MAG TPA: hypothetical protein VG847_00980 [Chitinophagaceae bacterium]|nr:hypothetical protein [Chitinophagaceae bacterium]
MNLEETTATSCFVSPLYCAELHGLGLSDKVLFFWEVYGNYAELKTHNWDVDSYYIDGEKAKHAISLPDRIIPAYNIKDIEKLIPPDWVLVFSPFGEYQIMPSNLYERIEGCASIRLPDVFALHLIECIRKHAVDLKIINERING